MIKSILFYDNIRLYVAHQLCKRCVKKLCLIHLETWSLHPPYLRNLLLTGYHFFKLLDLTSDFVLSWRIFIASSWGSCGAASPIEVQLLSTFQPWTFIIRNLQNGFVDLHTDSVISSSSTKQGCSRDWSHAKRNGEPY